MVWRGVSEHDQPRPVHHGYSVGSAGAQFLLCELTVALLCGYTSLNYACVVWFWWLCVVQSILQACRYQGHALQGHCASPPARVCATTRGNGAWKYPDPSGAGGTLLQASSRPRSHDDVRLLSADCCARELVAGHGCCSAAVELVDSHASGCHTDHKSDMCSCLHHEPAPGLLQ